MKCNKCNTEVEQGEKFCKSCGAEITETETVEQTNTETAEQTTQYTNETNTQNNRKLVTKSGININAICSLIFSIVCYFIFWWLSLAAIGIGIRALQEIKEGNHKGKLLAYAGIGLGAIGIIFKFTN